MESMPTSRSLKVPSRLAFALLAPLSALAAFFAFGAPGAQGAPTCQGKPATIVSNAAVIRGGKAPDVIVAGPGDNTIHGEGGNDLICGGEGNDTIDGERGVDTIYGEGGDDTLDGGAGNEDVIVGSTGNDQINGGPGEHDIADYAGTGGAVTVDIPAQTVSGAENEHLEGIEDAIGGSGGDTLIGAGDSRLDGGPGNDHLEAGGSGDDAFGGPGSDQCSGGFAEETSCGPAAGANGLAVEIYESIDGKSTLILTGSSGNDQGTVDYSGGKYTIGGTDVTTGDPTNPDCNGGGTLTGTGKVDA